MLEQKQNTSLDAYKFRVYFTTFLTVASLGGMLSMFSMVKDRLNKQLLLDEAFLSFLDSLLFIGRIVGSIFVLIFPARQPKKAYFIACSCAALCQLLLPISIFFGGYGMFGAGICKAFIMIPFLFLSDIFNTPSDKSKLVIWNSLNHIGDVVGIFFAYLTVYQIGIKWDLSYEICVFFYFIFAMIFYLAVQQKIIQNEAGQQNQNSIKNKIITCYSYVKRFYSKPSSFLWCMDYCLQAVFISNIVFWFPFFFVQNGFGLSTTFIAVAFYVAHVVGTVVFESAIKKFEEKTNYFCAGMLFAKFLILLVGTIFLSADKSQSAYYITMLTVIGFLSGGTSNRIGIADFLQLVGQDKKLKYYAIFFAKLCIGIFSVLIMTLIGQLMKINHKYLFYFMICNIFASFFIYVLRKFFIDHVETWFRYDPLEYAEVQYELNNLE